MRTLLNVLGHTLNGLTVHTGDSAEIAKYRTDSAGAPLFGKAFTGALKLAQSVAFGIDAAEKTPSCRGDAPVRETLNVDKFIGLTRHNIGVRREGLFCVRYHSGGR